MIASTPFRMRLTGVRRRLRELTASSRASEQTDIHWFLELKDASFEAERRIHDIDFCLFTLQDASISAPDRAREAKVFISRMPEFLEAVGQIRNLLTQRFPEPSEPTQQSHRAASVSRTGEWNQRTGNTGETESLTSVKMSCATVDSLLGVIEQLREADERLRLIARMCEERPSAMDSAALYTADIAMDVEVAVTETFDLFDAKVCSEGSPLRSDGDTWEAFREQRDEFVGFYRSILIALEVYREVLQAYRIVKQKSFPLQRGELKRIQQDKRVHIEERDACIRAFSDFQKKFSAMLAVFCPAVPP